MMTGRQHCSSRDELTPEHKERRENLIWAFIYPSVLCVHIWLLLHICIRSLFPYPPVSISCNVM